MYEKEKGNNLLSITKRNSKLKKIYFVSPMACPISNLFPGDSTLETSLENADVLPLLNIKWLKLGSL